jgi:hypothetical protein
MSIKAQFVLLSSLIVILWLALFVSGQPIKSPFGEAVVGGSAAAGFWLFAITFFYTLFPSLRPRPRKACPTSLAPENNFRHD